MCVVFFNPMLGNRYGPGVIVTERTAGFGFLVFWFLVCNSATQLATPLEGLSIPRSSVRFHLKPDNSNSHEFELHRPSNKGTKLLLKVIKAIIIISRDAYKWCAVIRPVLTERY